MPGCDRCRRRCRENHFHIEPDQLSCEVGQPFEPTFCVSVLKNDVLALDPTELAQPSLKRLSETGSIGGRDSGEPSYTTDLANVLLSLHAPRQRDGNTNKRNEFAPSWLIELHPLPPSQSGSIADW